MSPAKAFVSLSLVTSFFASCSPKTPSSNAASNGENASRTVLTTFYPVQYFAERIAQQTLTVGCPLPADADPIHWMPAADAIQAYQQADLILTNGAQLEKWLDKVTLPSGRMVETAKSFEDEFVIYENAVTHQHGPEGEHSHEGVDGHTWLDPINAIAQAQAIQNAFAERWPQEAETFAEGFAALEKDLQALDARLRAFAQSWGDRELLASHPAYNYLGQRYGLKFINLDLDPEAIPDQETVHEMEHLMEDHAVTHLLWESAPPASVAEFFTKLGLTNVVFSPCEGAPSEGDYLTTMESNLDHLEAMASETSPAS